MNEDTPITNSLRGTLDEGRFWPCPTGEVVEIEDMAEMELRATLAEKERDELRAEMLRWRILAQEMTPGGSEYMDPHVVRRFYQERKNEFHEAKKTAAKLKQELFAAKAHAGRLREALAQGLESLESFISDSRDPGTGALSAAWMMKAALASTPEASGDGYAALKAKADALEATVQRIYNDTEGYADGAEDASAHDKLCNNISGMAKTTLDAYRTPPPSNSTKETL